MKIRHALCAVNVGCSLMAGQALAQQPSAAPAAVESVKGVKEEAVTKIKNPETGNAAADSGGVTTGSTNAAQGTNKVNGVETINGVKSEGQAVVPPTQVPPPPPPAAVPQSGTAVPAGGGSVGTAAAIRSVQGVTGIQAAKIKNLEAALVLKQGGGGTPAGTGAENGGKGKAAAAALLAAPLEKPKKPKEDGRAGFQEFEKLQNNGS